ncbi:MAG: DUF47 family protein [Candidatus Helarchaeota archaeon]|nr:DUF47 family protein [Candidatus Helarchaeota archaeon]
MSINNELETAKQELRVLDEMQDYMRLVFSTIKELGLMLDDWIAKKTDSLNKRLKKITELESKAEDLKRIILDKLSEAEGLLHRGDLMRLVMKIDEIVDVAEGAGYRIKSVSNWKMDSRTKDLLLDMMSKVTEIMNTLKKVMFILTQNAQKAIKETEYVSKIEREIDQCRRKLMDHLYSLDLDFRITLRMRDLINRIEEIADLTEGVADAARIIGVTRRGFG